MKTLYSVYLFSACICFSVSVYKYDTKGTLMISQDQFSDRLFSLISSRKTRGNSSITCCCNSISCNIRDWMKNRFVLILHAYFYYMILQISAHGRSLEDLRCLSLI